MTPQGYARIFRGLQQPCNTGYNRITKPGKRQTCQFRSTCKDICVTRVAELAPSLFLLKYLCYVWSDLTTCTALETSAVPRIIPRCRHAALDPIVSHDPMQKPQSRHAWAQMQVFFHMLLVIMHTRSILIAINSTRNPPFKNLPNFSGHFVLNDPISRDLNTRRLKTNKRIWTRRSYVPARGRGRGPPGRRRARAAASTPAPARARAPAAERGSRARAGAPAAASVAARGPPC
jgi:hypothetical protein